jgi:hypothetical protein
VSLERGWFIAFRIIEFWILSIIQYLKHDVSETESLFHLQVWGRGYLLYWVRCKELASITGLMIYQRKCQAFKELSFLRVESSKQKAKTKIMIKQPFAREVVSSWPFKAKLKSLKINIDRLRLSMGDNKYWQYIDFSINVDRVRDPFTTPTPTHQRCNKGLL